MTEQVNNSKTIREAVADQIKVISPKVGEIVIETFVKIEVEKRAEAIVKGFNKLTEYERVGYKLAKGDVITYNADGSVAAQTFTKERLEETKKNTEKVEKITRALDKALVKGDLSDLLNLVK